MKENINIILYKLLLFGSTVLIVAGSINKLYSNNSTFKIDELIISGCNLVKEESIKSQISFIKDKNIFSLNMDDLKSKVTSNEFIASANIIRILPSTIIIDIIEISPIGLLKINDTNFIIDNRNNGFLCSANISNSIHIPEIKSNGIITKDNIFNSIEYKILSYISATNNKLFNIVDHISSTNEQIVVNTINSKIIFDNAHYLNQIDHVSGFLEHSNLYKNYKYIKFSHLDVIVKEKDII